jgi:hypothetical protein
MAAPTRLASFDTASVRYDAEYLAANLMNEAV